MLAPVAFHGVADAEVARATTSEDDQALAALLREAYDPTSIDHDPLADHTQEIATWRNVDGADDNASRIALDGRQPIGAALIARELDAPLLYEIAVLPNLRHAGIGSALLSQAVGVLAARGETLLAAWVTHGNGPSERLLTRAGFVPVTPPLQAAEGVLLYRASQLALKLRTNTVVAVAAEVASSTHARVWLISTETNDPRTIERPDLLVEIRWVDPLDSELLTQVATTAVPLAGATTILQHRRA